MLEDRKFLTRSKDYLVQEFETRKARRPSYSLRAFARDLNMSPSSLIDLLKDRSGFSQARTQEVAKKLGLSKNEEEHFWDLIQLEFSTDPKIKQGAQARINFRIVSSPSYFSSEAFKSISDWYHLAILEALNLCQGDVSLQTLSSQLDLPIEKIHSAIERLKNLGLLVEQHGRLVTASDWSNINSQVPSSALREFHRQVLSEADKALQLQDVKKRESYSAFLSIKKSQYSEFRDEVCKAIDAIASKYGSEEGKDMMIGLSLQTFVKFESPSQTKKDEN